MGQTALMMVQAYQKGQGDKSGIMHLLLDHGADVNRVDQVSRLNKIHIASITVVYLSFPHVSIVCIAWAYSSDHGVNTRHTRGS